MYDWSHVTATLDKPAGYVQGETMTVTLAGAAVETTNAPTTLTLAVATDDGSPWSMTVGPFSVAASKSVPCTLKSVADATGRLWTIAADGMSATATG